MNDFATLSGQPFPLIVAGKAYQVYPLTFADLGAAQRWIESQLPDPVLIAEEHLDRFPVPLQKHLLATALELASQPRPRIGAPIADALLRSPEGTATLLEICIRKGDPRFGPDQAAELFRHLTLGQLARFFRETGAELVLSDPKAPEAPTTTTTTTPNPPLPPDLDSTPGSSATNS